MCGIVGFLEKEKAADRDVLNAMVQTQLHRGPDDQGAELFPLFSQEPDFAMGFDRLSILDVSLNGHQPMKSPDGNVYLTFNGEIYNAFDYRDELIEKGYLFHSTSDTEVLLYLYEEYGLEGMLERINGMFAICIADRSRKKLYLIRDRFGVKPLYYWENEQVFLYASEYKAFYAHPAFQNILNEEVLAESLLFRFVAGRRTLLKGVYNVLPGHYLEIDASLTVEEKEYWHLRSGEKKPTFRQEDYERMLARATQMRLISDVPLGVQLSGGVDSSLALYYAKKANVGTIKTFSIVFEEDDFSEKKWIDLAAQQNGAEQKQYLLSAASFAELFELATWHCDSPLNHPNSIGIYLLCREAKRDVTVLVTGEGADELFGGYGRYSLGAWKNKHPLLYRAFLRLRGQKTPEQDFESMCINSAKYMPDELLHRLTRFPDTEDAAAERRSIFKAAEGADEIEKWLNYDLKTYLVDILNRQDKMSMAASVETRVPFLDYTLAEALRTQRTDTYVSAASPRRTIRCTKKPLKELAAKIYGPEFAYRKKYGFPIPLQDFFTEPGLSRYVETVVFPELEAAKRFRMDEIIKLWDQRMNCTSKEVEALWILIAHGAWMHLFLHEKERVSAYRQANC
ncbi:MAG: asparagine synthase (glutamine-hydrolyzing) [Oscillospiraceae bacterium]|nr:asparagine synthase (glutamine-hydrolyzing) [Oscillospiraceae bacterium]